MSDVGGLRRAAVAIYIATEQVVANDISQKLKWAADEIESLQSQRDRWLAKHAREVKSLQQKLKEAERERDVLLEVLHENGIQVDLSVLKDIG